MKGTFKITISPDGSKVEVDVGDIVGPSCVKLTEVFNNLGQSAVSEKKTEFYIETPDSITVKI